MGSHLARLNIENIYYPTRIMPHSDSGVAAWYPSLSCRFAEFPLPKTSAGKVRDKAAGRSAPHYATLIVGRPDAPQVDFLDPEQTWGVGTRFKHGGLGQSLSQNVDTPDVESDIQGSGNEIRHLG
jgi:hypothetical protein